MHTEYYPPLDQLSWATLEPSGLAKHFVPMPIAAPAALSTSERRYRRLFEAAREGILLVDPATRRVIEVNPFLAEFLGYAPAEIVGRELFEIGLLPDEAAVHSAFRELRANSYVCLEELSLQTKDGRAVHVEFIGNLYDEDGQLVIQCHVHDITERKKSADALAAARGKLSRHAVELEAIVARRTTELQLTNRQLEAFVYTIAHDLRAPLRTMQGFSQLLVEEHTASLSQPGRDYANFINTAAQTLDRLLADLLVFSQVSQEKIELLPLPLEAVVKSALAGCAAEISAGHALIENVSPWPVVLAHPATLRQVLVNLIGNAVKFVGASLPRVRLRAEERPDGIVRVWVEDNGIGIHPEFQERIFEVFQRLHTVEYPGTGIGLAIVQKGMERMGGRAGVVSSPGAGSRFWIELAGVPLDVNPRNESEEKP